MRITRGGAILLAVVAALVLLMAVAGLVRLRRRRVERPAAAEEESAPRRRRRPSAKVIILAALAVALGVIDIVVSRRLPAEHGFEFSLVPEEVTLAWLGGLRVPVTMLNAVAASLILIVLAVLVRVLVIPRFTEEPRGLQNVLEIIVEGVGGYTRGLAGSWAAPSLSPYIFTLGAYVLCSGLLEYFGMRPSLTDYNATVALALITFLLIQVYGIARRGLLGRLKVIGKPMAAIAPIKVITDMAVPVSLASRMFGNLLGGYIIMELIYGIVAIRFGVPAFLSLYFTLFHTLMQAFIFVTLSITFIGEVIE